jgi:hypothetical protein
MASTRRAINENPEHRHARTRRGTGRRSNASADWMKRCGAFVGFLGACVGVIATLVGLIKEIPEKADTKIFTDDHLRVVKVYDDQFEFQLAITLINEGQKPDTIRRPHAAFMSDRPVVACSRDVVFTDKQGDVTFPLVLQKDSSAQLTCIIKWKPSEDYYALTSEDAGGAQEIKPAVLGRIELTWPGDNRRLIARPFALLAGETIRELKPGVPRTVDYLYLDGDRPEVEDGAARSAAPPALLLGLQVPAYQVAGSEAGGAAHMTHAGMGASPAQATKSHYAAQGEIASGKEVPSSKPGELAVNIRPCGGVEEVVVFRAQFKKRILGMLPCGVQMVQVEKL